MPSLRIRIRLLGVALSSVALLLAVAARAERVEDIPNPRVRDGSWVTDAPAALRADTVQQINAIAGALERDTSAELAVAVVESLEGDSIEGYAVRLFEAWGIGKQGADNGVLLLWSRGDRRVRIEVGYGLEGVLPDGKAGAILDQYVIPQFREDRFDEGLLSGVQAIAGVLRDEPVALAPGDADEAPPMLVLPMEWVLGFFGLIPVLGAAPFAFRRWKRYRPRRCPDCGSRMARLAEDADDGFLSEVRRLEERLRAVDYDVWKCPSCPTHIALRYPRWWSRHAKCPQCGNRTLARTEETIQRATQSRTGRSKVREDCEFCSYDRTYTRTIPKISSSGSSSSGGRSSGSSSFGGGRSGGGGASRGY